METGRIGGRVLKRVVLELLQADDFCESVRELERLPARQVINPLFAFLLHADERVRWRAVAAMGQIVEGLAREDMESARVIMRRLMWSLNDESGGIGWGAPEAMAEIMASDEGLAREFVRVFVSYFNPEGNFLEYEVLQRGLLWGLIRLACVRPALIQGTDEHLTQYLGSGDPTVRGLAVWAAGLLRAQDCVPAIKALLKDESEVRVYFEDRFTAYSVSELAKQSLNMIETADFVAT
ncbi:MAG: HEAT repeat domain-containing protein [Desulfomonile tiedjei]|uniref:HEAT repeat domain-containing protein n=1 Tax=Desulfomonile tiedjei TaxID=2358 RepID=A0A9D6Z0A8_9BACT|nr:HEAT repeat domain-containing protein [Desulfomonile tiedjei]